MMDIEFIQEQHRDDIFKIMQLCDVDMSHAYTLYHNSGYNLEAAIQANFNPPQEKQTEYKPFQQSQYQQLPSQIQKIQGNSHQFPAAQIKYPQALDQYYDYDKPQLLKSTLDQKKLKEDRDIRRKQQQQFLRTMQQKNKQEQSKKYIENTAAKIQNIKREVLDKRRKISGQLKPLNHGQIISIKLRLPSSQSIKLSVCAHQKAQYLYDYIYSREQDLGFQQDSIRRVFDIIEPYQKINLSQRKNQTLGQIFEGHDMLSLVVNEIHQ